MKISKVHCGFVFWSSLSGPLTHSECGMKKGTCCRGHSQHISQHSVCHTPAAVSTHTHAHMHTHMYIIVRNDILAYTHTHTQTRPSSCTEAGRPDRPAPKEFPGISPHVRLPPDQTHTVHTHSRQNTASWAVHTNDLKKSKSRKI